jgi:hypothetical protein
MFMKYLSTVFLILFSFYSFSQSKKDLQTQLDSINTLLKKTDSKNIQLETDLKSLQLNLTNLSTSMSLVVKSNLDLEAQVKAQLSQIQKLESQVNSQLSQIQKLFSQNDSLQKVFNLSGGAKFVLAPTSESDSIIFVLQNYFKAKKWEERLALVLNPDNVKPLMSSAYGNSYKSEIYEKDKINIPGENYPLGKGFKVFVDGETVYLKKTQNGFKIDWEATTGYNAKSFALFHSEKSINPTVYRVELGLSENYPFGFDNLKSNYLTLDGEGLNRCLIANSLAGELKKILSDGKKRQVIVEAQYKTFTYDDGSGQKELVVLTKFIKEGWDQ